MHKYEWDPMTGGILLLPQQEKSSREPRPVYYREMNLLGMDKRWKYPQNDDAPIMWAEAEKYYYFGRLVARTRSGSLYTAPQVIYNETEEGEPKGAKLIPVNISLMCERNQEIMSNLVEDTVKRTYSAYEEYASKVDIFHVSFSGGKDSIVCLDIVQRAIPHNDFVVIFGDTGMELPDTAEITLKIKEFCDSQDIRFYTAKANNDPIDNWHVFGPPSTRIRWCCSVHKTTPQLLKLREIVGRNDIIEMAFVGVRASESLRRSGYEFISTGTKHKGQYSCNPILEWNSIEVYLHIFINKLQLNEAYKKGNSRVGCLLCPMAGGCNEYIIENNYHDIVDKYVSAIRDTDLRGHVSYEGFKQFVNIGGWKARKNGRDIKTLPIKYMEISPTEIRLISPYQDWTEWLKTLGVFVLDDDTCTLKHKNATYTFNMREENDSITVLFDPDMPKKAPTVLKLMKQAFRKTAYCVGCQECQADCPHGCITFNNGKVAIADSCRHCLNCYKADDGCLLYHSLEQPKGSGRMNNKSIDSYAGHAPKMEWIQQFFEYGDSFFEKHTLGTAMISFFKRFLRDAELINNNQLTKTARILSALGLSNSATWAIILINTSYSPEIGWYIKNVSFNKHISKEEIISNLIELGVKASSAAYIAGAYKRILALPLGGELGMGEMTSNGKGYSILRTPWTTPIPEVILYSLYKFAEACGDYRQFTLFYLMDETIERDGVSPTTIFGLDRNTMIRIINGLTINYPDFISASFSYDLDTITLRKEKKTEDVLDLL